MGVMHCLSGACRSAQSVARAVRPGIGTSPPGRPVADHAVFLVGFDVRIAHALEVVVGGIEFAHVRQAKEVVLALATPSLGGTVQACRLTAAPLTDGSVLVDGLIVVGFTRTQ